MRSSPRWLSSRALRGKAGARAFARWLKGDQASGGDHQAAELTERARLDLADALGGHAVLLGELVQRGLVVLGHPAPLDDVAATGIETPKRAPQARRAVIGALRVLDRGRRIRIRRRQVGGG